jgi:hypothetical protein
VGLSIVQQPTAAPGHPDWDGQADARRPRPMPETRFGVCNNVIVRNLSSHGSWADGLNVHGAHTNLLIEDCTIRNSGDDAFAMWSTKDGMKNVTFRNNVAYNPTYPWNGTHRDGLIPPWGSNHVNCFAAYGGGGELEWINNSCTPAPRGMTRTAVPHQWNDTAVVVFHTDFNGVFSPDSVATIRGNSFSSRTADGRPTRKNFPVCNWATPLSQRAAPRLAQPHDQPCTMAHQPCTMARVLRVTTIMYWHDRNGHCNINGTIHDNIF